MALIFQEQLELPEIYLPKEVFSDDDASKEAFYTAAATDTGEDGNLEQVYSKTKTELTNQGFSELRDLAIKSYENDQNTQNKFIVNNIIDDPGISRQDKKNALELYATGGFISSKLKDRYQSSIKYLADEKNNEKVLQQEASIEALDESNAITNKEVKEEKINLLDAEIESILLNENLPKVEKKKEVKKKVLKQIETIIKEIPPADLIEQTKDLVTLVPSIEAKFDGTIYESQMEDPSISKDFYPLKNLPADALSTVEFGYNVIKTVIGFVDYMSTSAVETYINEIKIGTSRAWEKTTKKIKEQNKEIFKALPKNIQSIIENNMDVAIGMDILDKSTKKDSKVNIEYLQKVFNTESGPNKDSWLTQAKLAEDRLNPATSSYNPAYVENWTTLTEIVKNLGTDVFSKELKTLQIENGIYTKHLLLALKPIYSAETTFGINNKISSTGAVGELQVIYPTFQDLIKNGYLGEKFVHAIDDNLVGSVEDLKNLSREEFTVLLSNNNIAAVLTGEAALLQKLKNDSTGFLINVEAPGDLTEEALKEDISQPFDGFLKRFNKTLKENQEDSDRYLFTGEPSDDRLFGIFPGYKEGQNYNAHIIQEIIDNAREVLNITPEDSRSTVTGVALESLGNGFHYLTEQIGEKTGASPAVSRALLETALIFTPIKGILRGTKRVFTPKEKPTELITKKQDFDFKAADADFRNPGWRDKYTTGTDQAPNYGSPKSDINPDSPMRATANANTEVAAILSKEVLESPEGSLVTKALGVDKVNLWNSWGEIGYGTTRLPLGGNNPDIGHMLDGGGIAYENISVSEIYNNLIETLTPTQAYTLTFATKVREELNTIVGNHLDNVSWSNSTVRALTNSTGASISYRADRTGNPIIDKSQVVEIYNKLEKDPNLNNIMSINKEEGGSKTVARKVIDGKGRKTIKGKWVKEKGYEIKPFVSSSIVIRDLKTGETYVTTESFLKQRKYFNAQQLIEAGPGSTVSITIPAYNQTVGKKTTLVPEKVIDIPIKKGLTGKMVDVTLPDGSVMKQYVPALLRRTAKGAPLEIKIDVDYISKQFPKKPWLSPKVAGVNPLPDIFKSPGEWVDFVLKHEIAHAYNPINPKIESRADYENRINNIALKEFKEQFTKKSTDMFEVRLEVETDYDVITNAFTPIAGNILGLNIIPGYTIKYSGNKRLGNWDIFSWILNNQRESRWVTYEIINSALENSYLSKRLANELVHHVATYKNKVALDYLLRDMKRTGRSINEYTDFDLFNMFGPTVNYVKIQDITKIKSIKDIPDLRRAANAYEQISKLENKIKNVYEVQRLSDLGYNKGVYENISGKFLGAVTDKVVSTKNNSVKVEIARIQESGKEIIELTEIDIPWITANITKVILLDTGKVTDFVFSKELSLANNKGQILDTEGRILVRLSKPISGASSSLADVHDIATKERFEPQNFYKKNRETKEGIEESFPDVPGLDHYGYALIDPTIAGLGPLGGDIVPFVKGYMPQIDSSMSFVDMLPLKVTENGTVIFDWRIKFYTKRGDPVGGKYNEITKRSEPVTEEQARTLSVMQKYKQAIARANTKLQAQRIARKLQASGQFDDFILVVRQAKESDPKEMMMYHEAGSILYESELANARQTQTNMVGGGQREDVLTAMNRLAKNGMKQNLFYAGFELFKKRFVVEFKDFLDNSGKYPKQVSDIGRTLDKNSLSKEQLNKLDTAKNQFETYARRLGEVEVGFSDVVKQRFFHYLADIVEGVSTSPKALAEVSAALRREGNTAADSATMFQRAISSFVIAGSPIKQLLLQFSPAIEAMAMSPTTAAKFVSDIVLLRGVALLDHPSFKGGKLESTIIAGLKATGWTDIEIPHIIKEVKRTLSQVSQNQIISEIISKAEPQLSPGKYDKASAVGKNIIGAPGNLGRLAGFHQSESGTSIGSVLFGVRAFKENNPGKNWWEPKNRAEVATNAYNFKGSMTKEGAMPWSHNALGQLLTFIQYNHKVTVAILHKDGFGLTDLQRAKLFTAKGAMWGTNNIPIWGFYAYVLTTLLAEKLEQDDREKLTEAGVKNPATLANKKSQESWLRNMDGFIADWLWRSAFKIAGVEPPHGNQIAAGMGNQKDIGLWETTKELFKLFDQKGATEPSIASLSVPGKIADRYREAKQIWEVPDGVKGSVSTGQKIFDTFIAVLSNYKVVEDIQKAILIHQNDNWIRNKHGQRQYKVNDGDVIQIMLGWGDSLSKEYYETLFSNLNRQDMLNEDAKLIHQHYQRWVDRYHSGDVSLPEVISELQENLPWMMEGFATSQEWTEEEYKIVERKILALEKKKLTTGQAQLMDLIIKLGYTEAENVAEEKIKYFKKYAPDTDYTTIFDGSLLD